MPKNGKQTHKEKRGADGTTEYAHNPRYCMILPDAAEPDEDNIASSSES